MPSQLPQHDRQWTRVGRVVYDRPIHYFSEADVVRISRKLVKQEPQLSAIDFVLKLLTDLTKTLMADILALVGLQAVSGPVVDWLVSIGNWIIETIGDVFSYNMRTLMNWMADCVGNYNGIMFASDEPQIQVTYYEQPTIV